MSAILTWIISQATDSFFWSLLTRIWRKVKESSRRTRVAIGCAAGLIAAVAIATPRLMLFLHVISEPTLPLPNAVSAQIRTSIAAVPHAMAADLLRENLPREQLWKLAQTVLAAKDVRIHDREQLLSHLSAQIDTGCRCWSPGSAEHPAHIVETAWILFALGTLGEKAPPGAIDFLLNHQDRETGAWPIHADGGREFSSTYATALSLLALNSHFRTETLTQREKLHTKRAIARASEWIRLQQLPRAARWADYPERDGSREVAAISGLILYSLHDLGREDLRDLDRLWLSSLPKEFPKWNTLERVDDLRTTTAASPMPDAVTVSTWPWLVIATSEAYQNGNFRERHRAARWVQRAFRASGLDAVGLSELKLNPEVLIALRTISVAAGTG